MLPRRIPKPAKRASRWRSQAHTKWIAGFACCLCGSMTNTIAAHVRIGSDAGTGQKPDDWRTVPLCDGPFADADGMVGCHNRQHIIGERTFWDATKIDVEALLRELAAKSPRASDICRVKAERAGNG